MPDIVTRKSGTPSHSRASSSGNSQSNSEKRKIVCLTAYDYPTARLVDDAGVDIVLVGDSLGMVVLGYENTLPLTMEEMLHHTRAVRRGVRRALLVADMPYGSFHGDKSEAVRNAVRFVKEAGAEAVKIEGGERRMDLIAQLVEAEIPVMGHIGLTPQSMHAFGGFRVQGKTWKRRNSFCATRAPWKRRAHFRSCSNRFRASSPREITQRTAHSHHRHRRRPECDGQILVLHDMIGLSVGHTPKFARRYANVGEAIRNAVAAYADDVREGRFPVGRRVLPSHRAKFANGC